MTRVLGETKTSRKHLTTTAMEKFEMSDESMQWMAESELQALANALWQDFVENS